MSYLVRYKIVRICTPQVECFFVHTSENALWRHQFARAGTIVYTRSSMLSPLPIDSGIKSGISASAFSGIAPGYILGVIMPRSL
jgi:hypothetical protein